MTNEEVLNSTLESLTGRFKEIDDIALFNQRKVLNAFIKNRVSPRHFASTTGYGYDDIGRDTLNKLFADIMCAEDAIVTPMLVSGTHAIAMGLYGLLRPGDKFITLTGEPYDTLSAVFYGKDNGSLEDYGITAKVFPLKDGKIDVERVIDYLKSNEVKLLYVQRSRGYELRAPIMISDLKDALAKIKRHTNAIVYVDNCYGEFTDYSEPLEVGANIIAGSLIKNAGGGIAPTGGYICGGKALIERIEQRLTVPSIGREEGSYASDYRMFYQGLFLAPHVTAQALKCAALFSGAFRSLGYETLPEMHEKQGDIVCSIVFGDKDKLIDFCQTIQTCSPIDGYVTPEPWDMPGYTSQVIMAAGAFVQGSSIELSADAPIREPFVAFLQGGLTFEHAKIALLECLNSVNK